MTGWRIGYIAAEKKLSATLRKLHYYTVLCPNAISQKAALAPLTGPQDCVKKMVTEYNRRRELVLDKLDRIESCPIPNRKELSTFFQTFQATKNRMNYSRRIY